MSHQNQYAIVTGDPRQTNVSDPSSNKTQMLKLSALTVPANSLTQALANSLQRHISSFIFMRIL